jgi:hypothetical protein
MPVQGYDRGAAVAYARRWALGRNPAYFDFQTIGGDCTNFASQCLFAGAGVMNFTPVTGWFYRTASDRTASWTAVRYLYEFLVSNRGPGPFARLAERRELLPGDLIQPGTAEGRFYHSLVVLTPPPDILVAAHTDDALDRPLNTYRFARARYLHVEGVN